MLIPSALIGVLFGIAQKKSIAILDRNDPSGFMQRDRQLLTLAP